MAFSGMDVGITESILLLCAIVLGGILCSVVFLQCCRLTAEGRAEIMYEAEHRRVLEQQRRTQASIDEAKEPGHKVEDSLSVSPLYVQLQSPQKVYDSGSSINHVDYGVTPGNLASAPPRPNPQINIELHKSSDLSRWQALANYSASIQREEAVVGHQPPLQVHAALSKSFMEEKHHHWDENGERRGKSFQFANPETGVTLKRVSSKKYKYDGRLVNGETPRLKLVDLLDSDNNNIRNESFDFGYERKTTEL